MEYSVIEVERAGHIATLWLNRPEKLNAFNPPMWEEIPHAVAAFDADDDVRVIIVAGRGRCLRGIAHRERWLRCQQTQADLPGHLPNAADDVLLRGHGQAGHRRRPWVVDRCRDGPPHGVRHSDRIE